VHRNPILDHHQEFTFMANAIRVLLTLGLFAPVSFGVGCQNSDSVANTELGPAPIIPAGRGTDFSGKTPSDPRAPKQPKK
jgi:hypothetical protein